MSTPQQQAEALAAGLYAHQVEGIAFLLGRQRAILADDMGLGKTRQSVLAMRQARPEGPYLVVCPAAVKINWAREIELVLPAAEIAVVGPAPAPESGYTGWVVINYDILAKHPLAEHAWSGLVFDEAHYLKNYRSQRHRLSLDLVKAVGDDAVVHLLTGTPLTSRPRDLFPLLQLVRHALGRSFVSFAKRYCDAYKGEYGWVADGASNIEELTVQLHGIMLLDLPPKIRSWLDVEVASRVAREMSEAVTELLQTISRRGQAQLTGETEAERRSRQGWIMGQLTTARNRLAIAKVRSTIPFVENALEQGEKVLVFSCYLSPVNTLRKYFGKKAVAITGEVPANERQQLADRFQEDDSVQILAAQITAGGVGLNLTAARQVVFNDLDWVPVNHWQAEDRAYRIDMVGSNTIDEFVKTILETKSALIDQLVEGSALPEDFQRDVMDELRRVMEVLPELPTSAMDEQQVGKLLREAGTAFVAAQPAVESAAKSRLPSAEAVRVLARVLAGPKRALYRVDSSSKPGAFYELEVEGNDISCSCKGFSYRGICQHARALKEALVKGEGLPEGFVEA
ncbi:MAG: SWIM zinc finger family protein [Candidatus Latescibacteria bacterium]|nr:SWIM zinc finger family protein [Candidatus Latescibacterota bacterium]